MNKQHYILTAAIGLALYLIATGLSFAAFTAIAKRKCSDAYYNHCRRHAAAFCD